MYNCIIIGGGAAGLFAALSLSKKCDRILVLEKNSYAGKKLRITGKGRCNITNFCPFEEVISNTPGNGSFLYSVLSSFSSYDIVDVFNKLGLETVVERGKRVFPKSSDAHHVAEVLLNELNRKNVEIRYESKVTDILSSNGRVEAVVVNDKKIYAKNVILATGGLSYPTTGSTGDGYKLARKLGHTITDLKPSLVPLEVDEDYIKDLQGLSLKNVKLSLLKDKKVFFTDFGEMLFTHKGISGPLVLTASRHYLEYENDKVTASIDLKPALSYEKLEARLQREFQEKSRKVLKNSLDDLLPKKMIDVFLKRLSINSDKQVNQLKKEEREEILSLLKNFSFPISRHGSFNEAVITVGGVSTKEISPKSLESKLVKGLYFAGEIIDLDAYTGGYNLTIAFSTGYIAGSSIEC